MGPAQCRRAQNRARAQCSRKDLIWGQLIICAVSTVGPAPPCALGLHIHEGCNVQKHGPVQLLQVAGRGAALRVGAPVLFKGCGYTDAHRCTDSAAGVNERNGGHTDGGHTDGAHTVHAQTVRRV